MSPKNQTTAQAPTMEDLRDALYSYDALVTAYFAAHGRGPKLRAIDKAIAEERKQKIVNRQLGEACELTGARIFEFLKGFVTPEHFKLIGLMIDLYCAPREITNVHAYKVFEHELQQATELLAVAEKKRQKA